MLYYPPLLQGVVMLLEYFYEQFDVYHNHGDVKMKIICVFFPSISPFNFVTTYGFLISCVHFYGPIQQCTLFYYIKM